jgi:signal transduction histidine kinase
LKYEFITIVTHKFRTPLTRIKWSLELLKGKQADEHAELAVTDIKLAEEALVELTDTLVDLTRTAQSGYVYAFERVDVTEKVRNTINTLATRFADKHIKVNISCPFDKVMVLADNRRILFALNILIENALAYTSDRGQISVSVGKGTHTGFIAIKDNGIGISKEDISKVLTRFWRSGNAKKMDTEGMGIGLYMANQILLRHKGSLSIVSEGEGKGSTFTMNIPLA